MNHRYLRIIVTCAIVGSITLALKQNDPSRRSYRPPQDEMNKLSDLRTSVEVDTQSMAATSSKKKGSAGTITIKSHITSEDFVVHKMGTHSPKHISITLNGQEIIEQNGKGPITVNEGPIKIPVDSSHQIKTRCRWAFGFGHKGENDALWEVEPGKEYTVSFNWNSNAVIPKEEDSKIKIEGAKLVGKPHRLTPEEYKATEEKNVHKKKRHK